MPAGSACEEKQNKSASRESDVDAADRNATNAAARTGSRFETPAEVGRRISREGLKRERQIGRIVLWTSDETNDQREVHAVFQGEVTASSRVLATLISLTRCQEDCVRCMEEGKQIGGNVQRHLEL